MTAEGAGAPSTSASTAGATAAASATSLFAAIKPVLEAVGAELVHPDRRAASDIPLVWEGRVVAGVRTAELHGALDRLIESVEVELGGRLRDLPREDKQRAVRMLDDRGAFVLRRAVEDVADAMRVSRITIYNYLNAIHRGSSRASG